MKPADPTDPTAADAQDPIERLVFACLQAEGSEVERILARHPAHAERVRSVLATLEREDLLGEDRPKATEKIPERLGDFRLMRKLGHGGMGIVYLAEEESLGRRVALKLVRPELLFFPGSRERFRREVEAVARLSHAGIVPVHAVGEEDGVPYFTMEYIDGCSLADVLERLRDRDPARLTSNDLWSAVAESTGGTVTQDASSTSRILAGSWSETCLRLGLQVAESLQHAHDRGVIHRDVKPSNILLSLDGRARILDFGVSTVGDMPQLTRTGSQVGSLPYMSPEHLDESVLRPGPRGDVYALGVTLYELLTLRSPYLGGTVEATRRAVLEGQPPAMRSRNRALSWEIETVCLTAMDRDPRRRYASAQDLARDLQNVLQHRSIEARRPGVGRRAQRWVQRHPTATVAIVLGSLLLVGTPLVFAVQQSRARHEADVLRDQAERRGYAASILAAEYSLGMREPLEAKRSLAESAEHLRGWEWRYLVRKSDASLRTLRGHEGAVRTVAIHPRGSLIASGGDDGTVRLWRWGEDVAAHVESAHAGGVRSLRFATDTATLYSSGVDGRILAWDTGTAAFAEFALHGAEVTAMALSPDQQLLATVGRDRRAKVWRVTDGERVASVELWAGYHKAVAWHPDGKELFVGGGDGAIRSFETSGWTERRRLHEHRNGVGDLSFNASGDRLLSAADDTTVRLWDLPEEKVIHAFSGYKGPVHAALWAAADSFYSAGNGAVIALRETTGYNLALLGGHEGRVQALALHPDGEHVVSGSADGTARVWNARLRSSVNVLAGHRAAVRALAVVRDGSRVISGGSAGALYVWDAAARKPVWSETTGVSGVRSLALHADERQILVGGASGRVELWDLEERRAVREVMTDGGEVRAVEWIDDERWLAAGEGGVLTCWRSGEDAPLWRVDVGSPINGLAVFAARGLLATADESGAIVLRRVADGELSRRLGTHGASATAVAFRPGGADLASVGHDGTLRVWKLATGELLRTARWQDMLFNCVTYSPDGNRIAAGVMQRGIRLWDADGDRIVITLYGHYRGVFDLAFSPDGAFLASASWDQRVWLWNAVTGEESAEAAEPERR